MTSNVRIYAFLKRKDGLSSQEFYDYWLDHHGKLIASLDIVQKNVVSYQQVRLDVDLAEKITSMGGKVIEFDGIGILEAESYEKLFEFFADPEYFAKVQPDEEVFLDREASKGFPGAYKVVVPAAEPSKAV